MRDCNHVIVGINQKTGVVGREVGLEISQAWQNSKK